MNERVYACFGQCERGWPGCNVDARVGECEGGPARTRATDAYATQRDNSHLSERAQDGAKKVARRYDSETLWSGWPQDGPERPKEAPRRPPGGPQEAKMGPRWAQDGPQEGPRWPQDGPRSGQDGFTELKTAEDEEKEVKS